MSRQRKEEVIREAEFVSIGELVRLTGARYSTLKFYTEEGFIPFEQEDAKLTRRYHRETAIPRIEEIQTMRQNGFTISKIKDFYLN